MAGSTQITLSRARAQIDSFNTDGPGISADYIIDLFWVKFLSIFRNSVIHLHLGLFDGAWNMKYVPEGHLGQSDFIRWGLMRLRTSQVSSHCARCPNPIVKHGPARGLLPPLPLARPCPQTDRSNCDLLAGELSSGYLLKRRHQARASRQPTWTRWGRRKALIRFRNPYSAVCKSGLNVVIMRCTRSNVIGWQTRATSPTTSWIS